MALVTGSSRNIGRAIVLRLAAWGADVIVNARTSRGEVESVVEEARGYGVRAAALLADVRDQRAVCDGLALVRRDIGSVEMLVNCAANRPERTDPRRRSRACRSTSGARCCRSCSMARSSQRKP